MDSSKHLRLCSDCITQEGLIFSRGCQHFDTTEGGVTSFALAAKRSAAQY